MGVGNQEGFSHRFLPNSNKDSMLVFRQIEGRLKGDKIQKTALWRKDQEHAGDQPLPRKLKSLGSAVKDASLNLLLLRTGALGESSIRLGKLLHEARHEAQAHAKPFPEVLGPVGEEITRFNNMDLPTLAELVAWLAARATKPRRPSRWPVNGSPVMLW